MSLTPCRDTAIRACYDRAMHQIIGQDRAVSVLQAALGRGRVPHAYIFHGPPGVGKFTTACAWARIVLCHDPPSPSPGPVAACGQCASCQRWLNPNPDQEDDADQPPGLGHPDVHVIRKELAAVSSNAALRRRKQMNIPVDLLRQWMLGGRTSDDRHHSSTIYQTAVMGHGKVFIIDQAELLDTIGQNALLKVLEEPPPGTYLVLVTSREDQLLMTLRSRCQRIAFGPLPDAVVTDWLAGRASGLSDDQRTWLVDFCEGSLGRAELAMAYDLLEWGQQVLESMDQMTQGQYPWALGADMAKRIDAFAKQWERNHANASKDAANRMAAGLMWTMIAQHARRRLTLISRQNDGQPTPTLESVLQPWLSVIDGVNLAQQELRANVNLGLVTDHLVSRLFRSLSVQPEMTTTVAHRSS